MEPTFSRTLLFLLVLASCFSACISAESAFTRAAPGIWRGVLSLEKFYIPVHKKDTVILLNEQFKEGELPFQFQVVYTDPDHFYMEIMNGTERIRCDSIQYGRDKSLARDTMNVFFPEYQSYIHAEIRGGVMQGEWVLTTKENYRIPFYAYAGKSYRFTSLNEKPVADISGTWAAVFGTEVNKQDRAIGEFRQTGNHLEGTFRTESGDYRFLEGTVQGRKFYLSCFDGAHAFLFSGSIQGDTLQGEFRSGKHYRTLWTAWKDPNFQLGDPDTLTAFDASKPFEFAIKTPEGDELRYPGPNFDNKVGIFTISGTWCPNCKDENLFLRDFLKENPALAANVAVTSFSFERNASEESSNNQLREYRKRLNLPYPVVYAGKANTEEAAKMFPFLRNISAFPTMIIVDKHHKIRSVHTGFDGPATSRYAAFKQEFTQFLTSLSTER